MKNNISKKKISDLTVEEYNELFNNPRWLEYGVHGIAKIFGVCRSTASKIKASGIIDDAIYQNKKTIVIDVNKALKLFGQKEKCNESS